jgi:hypothetical protein
MVSPPSAFRKSAKLASQYKPKTNQTPTCIYTRHPEKLVVCGEFLSGFICRGKLLSADTAADMLIYSQ